MKNSLLLFVLLFPCFIVAQDDNQAQKDSLKAVIAHTTDGKEKIDAYIRLTNIYYFEARYDEQKRDTLFALYDKIDVEAEKMGDDITRGNIRVNRLNVLNTRKQYDEVIKLAPTYLDFAEKKQLWNGYFQLYLPFITTYRSQGKGDEALALAQKMYDYAKGINNNSGMGMAFFSMASIYRDQSRPTEQEKCLRDAIALLQDDSSMSNLLANCYDRLGTCLVAQKRYDDAIQTADEMEKVIKRYEEVSGASQPSAWFGQHLVYISAYIQSNQFDKAEIYCNKAEQMTNGEAVFYEERATILASRGQYKEALEMADKAIEFAKPTSKLQAMGAKMMIFLKKEGSGDSEQLFDEIITLLLSKHNDEMNAQLDEIRTQYEVDKHIAEKQRNRNYFLFALGGCLLLAIALGIWIYHSRTIVKKNRGLYRQIKEQDRLADELEAMSRQYEQMTQLDEKDTDVETGRAPSLHIPHAPSLPGNKQQRQLVSHLREFLLKDRYFANYDLDIQNLVPEMATNRTSLFEAIKTVTGKTPMEFINSLRLDEAKRLLDNPDLTIETIALDCGFTTSSTFYRQFRERYRITPAEYRKIASQE
jgi:AraC-like DNA-binding protein/Flp pilus assembly protein TadD